MTNRKLNCVLLIDDNKPTSFLNKMLIEETGFANEVHVAQSAREALDYLSGKSAEQTGSKPPVPDLIFLDINMPAIVGFEFLEQYDRLSPQQKASIIVVILTTSFNPNENKAKTISYISSYKNKPLTEDIINRHPERTFRLGSKVT